MLLFSNLLFSDFIVSFEREHFVSVCMPSIWGVCVWLTSNDCKQKMESTKRPMFNILSLFHSSVPFHTVQYVRYKRRKLFTVPPSLPLSLSLSHTRTHIVDAYFFLPLNPKSSHQNYKTVVFTCSVAIVTRWWLMVTWKDALPFSERLLYDFSLFGDH